MAGRVRVRIVMVSVALAATSWIAASAQQPLAGGRKVVKTDAEWRKILTGPQFEVTRRKATEPAFSGRYAHSHTRGTYVCVCCKAPLFSSQTKFESGTGWPSFYSPINPKAVDTAPDFETGVRRIEVMCNDCGAHLGHVFDDGPPPTGLRYCMNSLALHLIPASVPSKKASTKKAKKEQAPATATEPAADPAPAGETRVDESKDVNPPK